MILLVYIARAQSTIPEVRLTLIEHEKTLPDLIQIIEQRSGLSFAYSSRYLSAERKISVHVEDELLTVILDDILLEFNVKYLWLEGKIVLVPANQKSEKYTISGFVKDAKNGENLIGATMQLIPTGNGVITNAYGFYSLTLPAEKYMLRCSYVGYKDQDVPLVLSKDITLNLSLEEDLSMLTELIISPSDSLMRIEKSQSSATYIDQSNVQVKPMALGEADLIKSLDVIPGVQLFRDGSTFFNVRGGDRDQNQILVDEAPIYNPAHMLGLFSSITPDVIRDVRLYKGNAPAEYGGRVSSIMDIRTKDGNMKTLNLNGSLGFVSGRLSLEGPIKKDKSSFFVSARRSYMGGVLRGLGAEFDELHFSDINAKVNLRLSQNNRLFCSVFSSKDQFEANGSLGWENNAGTIRWNHLFNSRMFMNTTIYASRYSYTLASEDPVAWKNQITSTALKSDLTYFRNPNSTLRFGVEVGGNHFNPGNIEGFDDQFDFVPKRNTSEISAYYSQEQQLSQSLWLNYGIRASSWLNFGRTIEYAFNDQFEVIDSTVYNDRNIYHSYVNLEPRLSLSWHPISHQYFKFNYTRSTQYINLISNSISPFNNLEVWLPASINIKPQLANQWSLSWIIEGPEWKLETEIYYKILSNQLDYTNQAELLLNPHLEGELRSGRSRAYGFETSLSRIKGKFTGRIAYSYSRSFRKIEGINGGIRYPTLWDRPHQLMANLRYDYNARSTLTGVFVLSSGPPISRPTSFYYYAGRSVPIYSDKHNGRLPTYHRFDVSWKHRLNKTENHFNHFLMFSIFNFYGRKNSILESFNKVEVAEGTFRVPSATHTGMLSPTYRFVYRIVPSITYSFSL